VISFHNVRVPLAVVLIASLVASGLLVWRAENSRDRTHVVAYFANANGIFVGDQVRILGVPVGTIDGIEPQPTRARISFWIDTKYKVPAGAAAVILSPALVTARAIQLTPAYRGGPTLANNTVIPQQRTAVPVEWDDFRSQLQRLTTYLQPTEPGEVSTLGSLVSTAANNLRGQGQSIHDALVKLSAAFSALGDHSTDIFSTVKNLSIVVSALQSSADIMRRLNVDLAAVSTLLANDTNGVGNAVADLNSVLGDVGSFVADNRDAVGISVDKLASISAALGASIDDIKQALHVAPNTVQNSLNMYQPAQSALVGVLAANNFANPISFICGAIEAASRLNAEQSAKLCVQYLAPIIKNRQYNFPPLGVNQIVGAQARPNEVTYSEDWMRPDYRPGPPAPNAAPPTQSNPAAGVAPPPDGAALPAEAPRTTDAAAGLTGMMVPSGAGS
jgi:phospholipid/cholesterol/gamma-HCH transport system substrate-binding protein